MSICASENAPHKTHYNYQAALVVSSFLWRKIFQARVLVSLIVEKNRDHSVLESLEKTLEMIGVDVIILEQEENISCVLMAQTARILAYNYQEVDNNDVIMTADTDLFPVDPTFLEPLRQEAKIWVFWWEAVLYLGESVPLGLLAMKASVWADLMRSSRTVTELTRLPGSERRVFTSENKTTDTWEIDQSITTTAILKSGLCSVPEDSHLWAGLRLTASSGQSAGSGDCWLGHGWGQCRASLGMSHYPGLSSCYWWHAHLPSSLLQHIVRNSWKNIWN